LLDYRQLVSYGMFKDEPPSGRFGLVEMEHADGKYYAFRR
jgi:hypothetical protein